MHEIVTIHRTRVEHPVPEAQNHADLVLLLVTHAGIRQATRVEYTERTVHLATIGDQSGMMRLHVRFGAEQRERQFCLETERVLILNLVDVLVAVFAYSLIDVVNPLGMRDDATKLEFPAVGELSLSRQRRLPCLSFRSRLKPSGISLAGQVLRVDEGPVEFGEFEVVFENELRVCPPVDLWSKQQRDVVPLAFARDFDT